MIGHNQGIFNQLNIPEEDRYLYDPNRYDPFIAFWTQITRKFSPYCSSERPRAVKLSVVIQSWKSGKGTMQRIFITGQEYFMEPNWKRITIRFVIIILKSMSFPISMASLEIGFLIENFHLNDLMIAGPTNRLWSISGIYESIAFVVN